MELPLDVEHQYSLAYEQLRRLAATVLAGEPFATISPTTLVHEVWLKLKGSRPVQAESELHFKRIAARAMRQVLVDAARRRNSARHGGGLALVSFDEAIDAPVSTDEQLLALDGALTELGRRYPRQAEMIESRYFAGLSVPETAQLLGVSRRRSTATGVPPRPGSPRSSAVPGEPEWDRLAEAFAGLADLTPSQQAEALSRIDDPGLRETLAAMLGAERGARHPLDQDVGSAARDLIGAAPAAPRRVGPYLLDRLLGEGGSAVVYLATRPDLDHRVAIKILRDAWLSPARRERFLLEQRTLAQLNHPAIARFHDADSFADGTPWLAMEYVPGVPITEYAEQQRLDIRGRLGLVRAVAEAMQHAHQRAVIHRDLKPSNILVTTDGTVKVVDFGIAKHLEDTGDPDPTRTGLRFMTPAYAAPEQLARRDTGTYTDVYALGVVCYQLLTGRLPYQASD